LGAEKLGIMVQNANRIASAFAVFNLDIPENYFGVGRLNRVLKRK
jgi:hypothetical protein